MIRARRRYPVLGLARPQTPFLLFTCEHGGNRVPARMLGGSIPAAVSWMGTADGTPAPWTLLDGSRPVWKRRSYSPRSPACSWT